MTPAFGIEALTSRHPRGNSTCGVAALDAYSRTQVTQDIGRRITTCFVAIDNASAEVAGFYTLAADAIALDDVPAALARRLPRAELGVSALVAGATDAAAASFYQRHGFIADGSQPTQLILPLAGVNAAMARPA